MAKRSYEELLKQYGLERKQSDFEKDMAEYAPKIKAGMEAAKERNKALALERNKALALKKAEAATHRGIEEASVKEGVKAKTQEQPVTVRTTKGGAATAELTPRPKTPTSSKAAQPRKSTTAPTRKAETKSKEPEKTPQKQRTNKESAQTATASKSSPPSRKGYTPENQDVKGINKYPLRIKMENSRKARELRDKRPKQKPLTIANLRNEYQQELIKKHKAELQQLRTKGEQAKASESRQAKASTAPKKEEKKSSSIASLRNEYQQELMKKHKKELAKLR